jgi:aspartyl-tRNA(Asn)/glutamyl-tRNA(Gln) amidotransferase subunit C
MSVDAADVRRIAHLARISLDESRVEPMRAEINGILQWIEQLQEVNVRASSR